MCLEFSHLMKYIYLLLLIFASKFTYGQENHNHSEHATFIEKSNIVRCSSVEYELELQKKYPERATHTEFETWMADKINVDQKSNRVQNPNNVYNIPVVIHVIHDGDAIGTNENISTARVLSQITVLNQDFRRMFGTNGFNSNSVGADIEIEFCAAQQTPSGAPTNGIDRINMGVDQWALRADAENMKAQTQWDPTKYFNVWVVYFTDDAAFPTNEGGLNDLLGYAQFPETTLAGVSSNTNADTDGVILDYRCFGSSQIAAGPYFSAYNLGRTITHEIGHSLGLRHIWGDNTSCIVNATDSNKDYCPDTPAAKQSNANCAIVYNSCPSAPGDDMTENYMDYSRDSCLNTFTINQKTRMRTIMNNSPRRLSLRTSNVCQALSNSAFNTLDEFKLFPNPANDFINISTASIIDNYEIINSIGQKILSVNVISDVDLSINISGLSKGVYFLKVYNGSATSVKKFIKN